MSGPDGERVFALEGVDYPYRVILEVLNEGVVTLGADGCILSCNTRFVTMVKMGIDHVLGRPLAEFVTGGDAPKLRSFLTEAAKKKGGVTTVSLALEDGSTVPVNISGAAFEVGGLSTLCVVVTDLTETFAAIKTRQWLASIVESSNDAVISISLEKTILTWNAAAEHIYGCSAEETVGQPFSVLVPPDRIQEVESITDQAGLGRQIQNYETVQITKPGIPIHVSLTVAPLADANGDLTGISVIARDITERKRAESELEKHHQQLEELVQQRTYELSAKTDELRSANEKLNAQREEMALANEQLRAHSEMLRKNEERLRLALQAGKMATWDWHIPTGEVTWNDEHYRMFGYAVGSVKPSYTAWISRVHEDDRKATEATFREAMTGGFEYSTEFRTCWPDRTVHWHWGLGGFDRDIAGRVVRSFGVLLEITDEKVADLRIRDMNDTLRKHVAIVDAANKDLDSYTHSVSHDLRTPLRFMNKIAHELLHDPRTHLSEGAVQKVNIILQAANEMTVLIENLLTFSQVARVPMRKQRVDMRKLFQEAVKELAQSLDDRCVEIDIQAIAPCRGDPTFLKEVAVNLLANEIKFTQHCNKARITIGCTKTNTDTTYFVQDNGAGFDMKDLDSVFVPFLRLHKCADFEGTGIGLALVKRIIERHGGDIWAKGEVGKGATFYFTLGEKSGGGHNRINKAQCAGTTVATAAVGRGNQATVSNSGDGSENARTCVHSRPHL